MVEKLQPQSRFACICICVYVRVSGSANMENLLWLGAKDELNVGQESLCLLMCECAQFSICALCACLFVVV